MVPQGKTGTKNEARCTEDRAGIIRTYAAPVEGERTVHQVKLWTPFQLETGRSNNESSLDPTLNDSA